MKNITFIDQTTGQLLREFPSDQLEMAYAYASELEEMGLDFKMDIPNVTETLTTALGLDKKETDLYLESVQNELEDHDGIDSCSACHPDPE